MELTVVDEEYGEQTASNVKTLRIESAGTSHITFNLTDDGEGNATLTVGVEYFDDSNSNSNSGS